MSIETLSPAALKQWQDEKRDFVLVDVREMPELSIAAIPGHLHIPLHTIPARASVANTVSTSPPESCASIFLARSIGIGHLRPFTSRT